MANATKREAELELQLWKERAQAVQAQAGSLNLQAQLLQLQSKECADNVTRLEAEVKALEAQEPATGDATAAPLTGGGPGEDPNQH